LKEVNGGGGVGGGEELINVLIWYVNILSFWILTMSDVLTGRTLERVC